MGDKGWPGIECKRLPVRNKCWICGGIAACSPPKAGLRFPADKCPYDPLALLLLLPFIKELTREFGEYLIIELISNESEYGDEDKARFLLVRLARRLLALVPSILKWKSALANELGGWRSEIAVREFK